MDFVALIIFLGLYYLRPQEWFSAFNALRPVQLLSVMALWAMIQNQKLKPRELVRTPLDWLVLTYFLWTIFASGQYMHTLTSIEAVLLFYFVAVVSLDSVRRQKTFLGWWCIFMIIVAALALASNYGLDPLGSHDKTEGAMKGRLILNLSVFNNPNALAHSVVPAVPLVYYLFFWRRTFLKAGLILIAIPLYCIFLTQSKGAFICGAATLLATLTFGRSRVWQLVILLAAVGFGYGALYALPRMNELRHSKTDPAIQGRVAAFQYGLHLMQTHFFGIGLSNFQATFLRSGPLEKQVIIRYLPSRRVPTGPNGQFRELDPERIRLTKWNHYSKATHSAYNQNGAELGYVGLYLFVGILYCCIRTLVLMKCEDDDEERIRRALFALVVAYAVSSWMVDFCYRPTFFMMIAAISAFHRHLLRKQAKAHEIVVEQPLIPSRPWLRRLPQFTLPGVAPAPAGSAACLPGGVSPATFASSAMESVATRMALPTAGGKGSGGPDWKKRGSSFEAILRKNFIWTRLGVVDFLIILLLTYCAILYWKHLIATM